MSKEIPGLSFSAPSPARHEAVRSERNYESKRPFRRHFERVLLPMILLAGICGASESAYRTAQTASLFALDSRRFEGSVLVVCLFAAAAFGCVRLVLINLEQGRKPQTKQSAPPFMRAHSSSFWRARDDERKHLSRELHDSVGQILTAVGLQLRALRSASLPPDQLRMHLDETCRMNAEALRLVRDLAMGLRPALLDDVSLVSALEWHARQFSRQTGISAALEAGGDLEELPEAHRTCIYRCVQEALTNCAKHAQAKSVRIVVRALAESVTVTIEDDGIGFDLEKTSGTGLGLLGMRERAAGVNGKLSLMTRQHGGTALTLEIPVPGGVPA